MKSQAVTYPQLFDFALIVGLEPMSDEGGYRPYIVYKFPEQVGVFRMNYGVEEVMVLKKKTHS